MGDADGVPANELVGVGVGIHVDAPHKLEELACLSLIVSLGFIYGLADEVKGHSQDLTFSHLRCVKVKQKGRQIVKI